MRHVIDATVEDALRELSDEQAQRRLWMASGGPEVSSLIECSSRLWDDSGLADALDSGQVVYRPDIDAQFEALEGKLKVIDEMRPPAEILDDPRLIQVRSLAGQLLAAIRDFGYDK